MAANADRVIVVRIVGSDIKGDKNSAGSVEDVKNVNSEPNKLQEAKALVKMGLEKVSGTVMQTAQVSLNRYFSMSENYMAETDYQNAMTLINKGKSFYSSLTTSALAGGSIGGAFGVAVGAIIGATSWVANEYVNYQQRMSNYYQNLNATRYQTEFDRTRMGLTNEGKGTEN